MSDKIAEKQLRNKLLAMVPSGIGVYDVTGTTIRKEYLNDGYFQMLNVSRDMRHQYDGTHTAEAVHPDDRLVLISEMQAALRENRPLSCRIRIIDGQGDYRWLGIKANHEPLDHKTTRFYAAYYDIDSLIRAQDKLQDNEVIINEALRHSDTVHFVYYLKNHHYEILVLPEAMRPYVPLAMDNFPDTFIKATHLNSADAEKYRQMVKQIDQGALEADCTVQVRDTGKYTWYRVKMRAIHANNGKLLRAIGSATNIENYKKAEEAFDKARRNLASLQDNVVSASCLNVTKDYYTQLDWNKITAPLASDISPQLYEEALAIEPALNKQGKITREILIKACAGIPNPQHRSLLLTTCCNENIKKLFASGQREINFSYRTTLMQGLVWLAVRIAILQDPVTGDLLALTFTKDINNEVISRKLTDRIVDKNYAAVAYLDLSTQKFYTKWVKRNTTGEFKEDRSYETCLTELCQKLTDKSKVAEISRQLTIEHIKAHLAAAPLYSVYASFTVDGPAKQIRFDIFYLDEQQDILVFLFSNITAIFALEEKHRQQLTAALQTAEAANAAKTEFLSRISHDIRTPLGIISNMTDFALADIHDETALRNDLAKIKSADGFLLSLINDVLDISKIDSGKIQLNPEPYSYEDHYANNRNMLQPMCESKCLRFEFKRLHSDVGIIIADKIRLNQITLNVLSNAVKYTPPGGTITYVSTTENLPHDKIRYGFEITDTGIGMSEEFQKKLFEPFTQEHANPFRQPNMAGTGLGMAIVKKLVDLMGGTISVESKLGKGTTVRCSIVFPDAKRDPKYKTLLQKEVETEVPVQKDLQGTILIVEDHPVNSEIAKRILQSFGLKTAQAKNGQVALEMFKQAPGNTYQAILMDIQMPIMNGYEATRHIRALPRPDARRIPIIAMTADAFSDAMDKGLEAGMNEYLVKPLDPQKLYQVLKERIK